MRVYTLKLCLASKVSGKSKIADLQQWRLTVIQKSIVQLQIPRQTGLILFSPQQRRLGNATIQQDSGHFAIKQYCRQNSRPAFIIIIKQSYSQENRASKAFEAGLYLWAMLCLWQ